MEPTSYLAKYGIATTSLSPDVKDGITEVLRAATTEGLKQFGQILQREAQKRGINTGGSTQSGNADEAVQAATEEYERLEAEKKAKNRRMLMLAIGGGLLIIGLVVAFVISRKPKKS